MQELQPMKLISCDLFDRHDHRAGQSKMVYYHIFAVLGVVCGVETKDKI